MIADEIFDLVGNTTGPLCVRAAVIAPMDAVQRTLHSIASHRIINERMIGCDRADLAQ